MPDEMLPTNFHTLIHLGCGASPHLDEYQELAEHVWLIDADTEVISILREITQELEHVHTQHALVDTKQTSGIFYRYSQAWANGLTPLDEDLHRIYPGLHCIGTSKYQTTPIDSLLSHCLPEEKDDTPYLLLLDVGRDNAELLPALERSGILGRMSTVIVLPAHRRAQAVAVPPSLHAVKRPPEGLTLPENCQVLTSHPLLSTLQQHKKQIVELETLLNKRTTQIDEITHDLRKVGVQLEQSELERNRLENRINDEVEIRDKAQRDVKKFEEKKDELTNQLEALTKKYEQALKQAEQRSKELEENQYKLAETRQGLDSLTADFEKLKIELANAELSLKETNGKLEHATVAEELALRDAMNLRRMLAKYHE